MLVEELMILANEAVGALLAGRNREALYRVHERPDPQSIQRLLAMLADLEVPTPPAPDFTLVPKPQRRTFLAISAAVVLAVMIAAREVMLPFILATVLAYVLTE